LHAFDKLALASVVRKLEAPVGAIDADGEDVENAEFEKLRPQATDKQKEDYEAAACRVKAAQSEVQGKGAAKLTLQQQRKRTAEAEAKAAEQEAKYNEEIKQYEEQREVIYGKAVAAQQAGSETTVQEFNAEYEEIRRRLRKLKKQREALQKERAELAQGAKRDVEALNKVIQELEQAMDGEEDAQAARKNLLRKLKKEIQAQEAGAATPRSGSGAFAEAMPSVEELNALAAKRELDVAEGARKKERSEKELKKKRKEREALQRKNCEDLLDQMYVLYEKMGNLKEEVREKFNQWNSQGCDQSKDSSGNVMPNSDRPWFNALRSIAKSTHDDIENLGNGYEKLNLMMERVLKLVINGEGTGDTTNTVNYGFSTGIEFSVDTSVAEDVQTSAFLKALSVELQRRLETYVTATTNAVEFEGSVQAWDEDEPEPDDDSDFDEEEEDVGDAKFEEPPDEGLAASVTVAQPMSGEEEMPEVAPQLQSESTTPVVNRFDALLRVTAANTPKPVFMPGGQFSVELNIGNMRNFLRALPKKHVLEQLDLKPDDDIPWAEDPTVREFVLDHTAYNAGESVVQKDSYRVVLTMQRERPFDEATGTFIQPVGCQQSYTVRMKAVASYGKLFPELKEMVKRFSSCELKDAYRQEVVREKEEEDAGLPDTTDYDRRNDFEVEDEDGNLTYLDPLDVCEAARQAKQAGELVRGAAAVAKAKRKFSQTAEDRAVLERVKKLTEANAEEQAAEEFVKERERSRETPQREAARKAQEEMFAAIDEKDAEVVENELRKRSANEINGDEVERKKLAKKKRRAIVLGSPGELGTDPGALPLQGGAGAAGSSSNPVQLS
jgi:hypothetical protein